MPLIETDTIIGFLNKGDRFHREASFIFRKIHQGELDLAISSASLIELQLIYKSKNIEFKFEYDLAEFQAINNLRWAPLNVQSSLTALNFRKRYNLSFFDSLHVGIAINLDKKIIAQDKRYDDIKGLEKISLAEIIS
ncbi:MAG: type II toxin-antitoxin system VapC family toxin [Promethearchaeia archaeon]